MAKRLTLLLSVLVLLSCCGEYGNAPSSGYVSAPSYQVFDVTTLDYYFTKRTHSPSEILVFTPAAPPMRPYRKAVSFGIVGYNMSESACIGAAQVEAAKFGVDAVIFIVQQSPSGRAGGAAVVGVIWTE